MQMPKIVQKLCITDSLNIGTDNLCFWMVKSKCVARPAIALDGTDNFISCKLKAQTEAASAGKQI